MNTYIFYTLLLTVILLCVIIKTLNAIHTGQKVRILLPEKHFSKTDTPNIGGVAIILSVLTIYFLYLVFTNKHYDIKKVLMLFLPFLAYGLLGLLDDMLKIIKKNTIGVKPMYKILYQVIFSIIYYFLFIDSNIVNIFGYSIDLKYFYLLFIIFLFVFSTNSLNLTDGLDGLASGITMIILLFVYSISTSFEVDLFIVLLSTSLFAFILLNFSPSKVFLGDTGSLALGGAIGSIFIVLKIEILLFVFCLVLCIEALSVVLQVTYFKLTHGKRIFKMTPIHHHFELLGIKENKIVFMFWIITFIISLFSVYLYRRYF